MTDAPTVGEQVRWLRLATGRDQKRLSIDIGKGDKASGTVSRIENGQSPVDDATLRALARTLGCTVGFLTNGVPKPPTSQPSLRAYADASKKSTDRQVADLQLVATFIRSLQLPTIRDRLPDFSEDPSDEHAVEEAALETRRSAGLEDDEPVGNAIRSAERLGCVVVPMQEGLGRRHLGLSLRVDGIPMICVPRGDAEMPGDRQRFTVAHELGHLVLHSDLASPVTSDVASRREREAHLFAGALLAPGDALCHDFFHDYDGRATLTTLRSLKAKWGIAIKALVMRFRSLQLIDEAHARSLYKQISARGWNKGEPVEVAAETGKWLSEAMRRNGVDPRYAVQRSGLAEQHLQRWLAWETVDAEIVNLESFVRRRGRSGAQSAS